MNEDKSLPSRTPHFNKDIINAAKNTRSQINCTILKRTEEYISNNFNSANIFHSLKEQNGLPKDQFLQNIIVRRPYIRGFKDTIPIEAILTNLCKEILDEKILASNSLCILNLEKIRSIFIMEEFKSKSMKWVKDNHNLLSDILAVFLRSRNRQMIRQGCYTVSFLAYNLKIYISNSSLSIAKNLVYSLSYCTQPVDEYLLKVQNSRRSHADKKLLNRSQSQFKCPRFILNKNEAYHIEISCIVYSLAFLLDYVLHPDLIFFYTIALLERTEIVRFYLLKLLHVLLQSPFISDSFKSNDDKWQILPVELFYSLMRISVEPNKGIAVILDDIFYLLRINCKIRLPNASEFTNRVKLNYEKYIYNINHPEKNGNQEMSTKKMVNNTSEHIKIENILERYKELTMNGQLGRNRQSPIMPVLTVFLSGLNREVMDNHFSKSNIEEKYQFNDDNIETDTQQNNSLFRKRTDSRTLGDVLSDVARLKHNSKLWEKRASHGRHLSSDSSSLNSKPHIVKLPSIKTNSKS